MKKIEVNDFYGFKYLSELKFAPNGKLAAFVATMCGEDGYGYDSNIYVYDLGTKKYSELTSMGDSRNFAWLSNTEIIFPAKRAKQEKGSTSFYKISINGGEAKKLFNIPHEVVQFKTIDSENIAFTSKFDHSSAAREKMTEDEQKEENDYIVIDELPFWANGRGFINKTRKVLNTYSLRTEIVTAVSDKWSDVDFFNVQKRKIVFSAVKFKEKRPTTAQLCEYDLDTQKYDVVVRGGSYKIDSAGYVKNKLVAFMSDMKKFGVGEISQPYVVGDGEPKIFARNKYGVGNGVSSDSKYGGGQSIMYTDNGIYFTTVRGTNCEIHKLSADSKDSTVMDGAGSCDMFDVSHDTILYIGMRENKLQELYEGTHQLTVLNEEVLLDKALSTPIPLDITSDGVKIEGFIMEPVGFDSQKKYPGILNVHGGPRATFSSVYTHEMQVWASRGYFVFFTNPRGSDGRGNEFSDLRGKYGTIDFDDILRFTDAALKKYPQLDPNRLGITGGSYGGFMTNWAIGNTDKFAAAVSQRSLTNWISLSNLADIGYTFDADQMGADAWSNMQKMWDQSPLKFANRAKTPTLFIHSEEDYRCNLSEGMQMFSAIKNAGCTARMCIFKGENHELSRSGKPRHRARRIKEITAWFDKYLKEND